ncbi:MAG: hypothetical protein GY754_32625 [bacterium]|nr:hypothetical protein [bacterium]
MNLKFIVSRTCLTVFIFCTAVLSFVSCDNTLDNINAKIAVVSDLHYYSPDLRTEGAAFQAYSASNYKLIAQSDAINSEIIDNLKEDSTEIVIMPGDLTKDGEKISHIQLAEKLRELEDAGKKVYVINGNHDINNPNAVEYYDNAAFSVENITPADFEDIYGEFGFDEALDRDPHSLSYVVEPIPGLRLLAIDSCIYESNAGLPHSVTGGKISAETLAWIQEKMDEADNEGKVISAFMHHGLIPHFSVQTKMFPDFVVEDWENVAQVLVDGGIKTVFTGHYHAMDVSTKLFGTKILYDIETPSTISYPCSYRKVKVVKGRKLILSTEKVEEIDYDLGGADFQEYAEDFAYNGIKNYSPYMIAGLLMKQGLPQAEAVARGIEVAGTELAFDTTVGDMMARGLMAHLYGGEFASPENTIILVQMLASDDELVKLLGGALFSLWLDTSPIDKNTTIYL